MERGPYASAHTVVFFSEEIRWRDKTYIVQEMLHDLDRVQRLKDMRRSEIAGAVCDSFCIQSFGCVSQTWASREEGAVASTVQALPANHVQDQEGDRLLQCTGEEWAEQPVKTWGAVMVLVWERMPLSFPRPGG